MKNTDEFYTAEELAEKLRVNIMTIYRSNKLPNKEECG